ncbi:MAG: phosphoenolpyruvate--protein phosphotransferase [Clostridium sp.]
MILNGIGASSGVAIGKVFIKTEQELVITKNKVQDVESELKRFKEAQISAINYLDNLYQKAIVEVGEEEALIFDMHKMLLEDQDYIETIENTIKDEMINAEYAVSVARDTFVDIFETMEDAYMRERAADIRDISGRLITILSGINQISLGDINEPVIVIAKDLFPSDTIQMNKKYVMGFVTECGGKMSHSAILARTMQIPAIVGTENAMRDLKNNDYIILDGKVGNIYVNPTPEEVKFWTTKKKEHEAYKQSLLTLVGTKSMTKDGIEIEINANIGSTKDLEGALENDAEGVGLFRSEFLYMDSDALPTEEEQFIAYKTVLEGMNGKRVIIRTLDVGGDKEISYLKIGKEENPFLGYRAIRVCLDQVEMFKTQLRALLRASAYGRLGIMIPMIISVDEVKASKALVEECKAELLHEGMSFSDTIEIGIMIETPAAAMVSDLLAREVDFFSIGTNDLTQYILAVDRMNAKISHLYNAHNPAVLRAIKMVTDNAHAAGIWVGVCGESAADLSLTETFAAIGIDELSVSAGSVLELRKKIQSIDVSEAKKSLNL